MMYPKDFVKKLRSSLPDEIERVISSEDTLNFIESLADTYQLTYDQSGKVGYEINMLLLGLTDPDQFSKKLTDNSGLQKETAQKIAKIVATTLMSKIPGKVLEAQLGYAQAQLKELPPQTIEVTRENLPEVLPGEVAHEVPHMETPAVEVRKAPLVDTPTITIEQTSASTPAPISQPTPTISPSTDMPDPLKAQLGDKKLPDITFQPSDYNQGQDPYREPLQ